MQYDKIETCAQKLDRILNYQNQDMHIKQYAKFTNAYKIPRNEMKRGIQMQISLYRFHPLL